MNKIMVMPGLCCFILFLFLRIESFAATQPVVNEQPALNIFHIKLSEILRLKVKELGKVKGEKLTIKERIQFFLVKEQMKKWMKKHGDMTLIKYLQAARDEKKKFNWLWFIIGLVTVAGGLFLSILFAKATAFLLLPVIVAVLLYATKQDQSAINAFWLGFGIVALCVLILLIIAAVSYPLLF